jgi:hypothetical protein
MKTAMWIRALAVTALVASACGGTPAGSITTASPSSEASPTAIPSASPIPVAGACHPCLALVTLRGSSTVVVRDITDINHPRTVGKLGADLTPVFVSASEVSYDFDVGIYRVPLVGSPRTDVTVGGGGRWSPDGSALAYLTVSQPVTIRQLKAGHDQLLGTMAEGGGGGGCETIAGCTLPNWFDWRLSYSPDGTLISLVVDGFGVNVFRVWSSDGTLLTSNDNKGITMSAWSGPGLYFRDGKGVEVLLDRAVTPFLPGVMWIKPQGSPAGGQIVYTVRDSSGWGHIRVVDTTTGKVRELKSARTDAVFLTSRYIWYQGERACVTADGCGSHPPFHPLSGKTYIYDLKTGAESESIITSVFDVWPHPA